MGKLLALLLAVCSSLAVHGAQRPAPALNVAGTWQAILPIDPPEVRMVVRITRAKVGGWDATMYLDDANPIPVESVTVHGAPLTGYSADRLGDDVLAVLDALHLDRPILAGHSIAGEELSSVGSRYPQRVAGLIYLDAGYPYAYYGQSVADDVHITIDVNELARKLDQLRFGNQPADPHALIQDLLNTELPDFTRSLLAWQQTLQPPHVVLGAAPPTTVSQGPPPISRDMMAGLEKYTSIPVAVLAIFATPHELPPSMGDDPAVRDAIDEATTHSRAQADAFEKGVPSAHVVRLAHASHDVFRSNEADVLREMNAFIGSLPK